MRTLLLAFVIATGTGHAAESGVDANVAPGDDFFRYANAQWLDATTIPAGKPRWGPRNEIGERATQQVAQVIHDPGTSPAGRKIAAFRDAFLDEARIERNGLAPIAPMLKGIDALRDKAALARWLGAHMQADVDPLGTGVADSHSLFGLAASYGIHGETRNSAYLVQGGVSGADLATVTRAFESAVFDNAARRAEAVVALEAAIAKTHASAEESGKESNADNRWKRWDFATQAPGIDWSAFFAAAGLARVDEIVVWQPNAIKGSAALIASQPLPAWQDYLRFHVLRRYAEVLPAKFRRETSANREQRAIEATNLALPDAVGRVYVQRSFPPSSKARMQKILEHVVAAFRPRVTNASWLSAESKRIALAKLDALYFGVAYPDRWPDDATLRIDAHDPVGNLQRIAAWKYRRTLAQVGKPVDRKEWAIAAQAPGGLLNFQLNTYNFTAALLQPPRFDPEASDATNYGAIGVIFAHEVSHYVDTLGADYDVQGASRNWWSAEDKAKYEAATLPLVEQFSAYRPFPDQAVDGKRTLVENLADLGGLVTAFDAYRAALGKGQDAETLRRMDREFFLGFARSWRSKMTDEALRAYLKADAHAPDDLHVAAVRNVDAWYEAFDVKPGQRLYLPPEKRVRVW